MRRDALSLTLALVLAIAGAGIGFAQRDMGTLLGSVTDPSGAAIPGATITITEESTGVSDVVESDAVGNFIRPLIKPGAYTISCESPGFKRSVQSGVILQSAGRVQTNFVLEIGEVTETIEILATPPALQTETTQMGGTLENRQTSELPLGGQRRFAFLARTVPAVVPAEPGARDAAGGGFSANGVRSNGQNNFLLNGVDNNVNVIDFINQTAYVVGPSVEAIGEMQILTNGYNAEYGRAAGGVVNVTIKSGTNDIHGTIFEFLQNDKANANTWENNRNENPRQAFKQNQFGAAVGGPIAKNRTFWFADYQGTIIRDGSLSSTLTVPSPGMANGDFSNMLVMSDILGPDALGRNVYRGQIFDRNTQREVEGTVIRDAFPNNRIPNERFDSIASTLINQYPQENQALTAAGQRPGGNYFTTRNATRDVKQWDVRVDHRISDNDSLFGSISWIDEDKFQSPPLPGYLDAGGFLGETEQNLSRAAMMSYTKIWSPTFITESRVAYSRLITTRVQANADTNSFQELGFGGLNPFTTNNGGLMRLGPSGYSTVGGSEWLPTQEYNNVWDFIQNVSWNKGSHAIKFGAEYRPIGFPFFQVPSPRGQMRFDRADSNQVGFADTGDGMASWLLGDVNWARITTANFISSFKDAYSFFVQDDWKVSSKLTVNIGVRYELTTPIGEKFGRQAHLDVFGADHAQPTLVIPKGKDQDAPLPPNFVTDYPEIAIERGVASTYLTEWDRSNIAPRIGFAYEVMPGTVIRAGYGIFYGAEENEGGNPNRGENVPFNQETRFVKERPSDRNPYVKKFSDGFPTDAFTLPAPISFRSLYTQRRWPLVNKWNFNLQRDLGWNSVLEVAYIGSKGNRLTDNYNGNPLVNDPRPNIPGANRRPFKFVGNTGISFTNSNGRSTYNAFTAKLDKRYSDGVGFLAAYTWGHALADTGTTLSGGPGNRTPHQSLEYAHASFDVRHRFVLSGNWRLPFGNELDSPAARIIVGGWQMNGILTLQTGNYFSVDTNRAVCSCSGTRRPDPVSGRDPNAAPSGGRTPEQWFDTSAFQDPAVGTFGALGNYSNIGPPTQTVDLSLFKDFPITETAKVQFRIESFNLFNTPQFNRPSSRQGLPTFGRIFGTRAGLNRNFQFALRFMF